MTEPATTEKLGELLLREGRLTAEGLERALDAQRLVGGRLGTNLLELGLITESVLLEALGRQRSNCTAGRAELGRIAPTVLRSVPEKLAKRYRLVPYEVRGKTLYVASCDPGDLLWEDEISFLSSFMVRTCVALEFHVMLALRQHYKIPVDRRFLALAKRQRSGGAPPPPSAKTATSIPSTVSPSTVSPSTVSPTTVSPPTASPTPTASSTPAVSPPAASPTPATSPSAASPATTSPGSGRGAIPTTAEAPDVEFIELDADDLAMLRGDAASPTPAPTTAPVPTIPAFDAPTTTPALDAPAAPPAADPSPAAADLAPAPTDDFGAFVDTPDDPETLEDTDSFTLSPDEDPERRLAKAAMALQQADIRDEIGDVLLTTAGTYFARRLLLIARRGRIVGWRGEGEGLDEARIRELDLDEKAPSIFAGLRDAGSFWLGPLPPLPANRQLIEALGGPAPKNCLALPIVLRSRVVAHLYADDLGRGVGGGSIADMKRLASMAGLAFEVYILKNKIRMI